MKIKIGKMFNEMIPVVLGVLIALFINNWNEKRNDDEYINKVMFSIKAELKENKNELEEIIKEHEQIIDTIIHYQDTKIAIGQMINKVSGLRFVGVKNTAWKALVNSRIELLDYDKISILTDIDEEKLNRNLKIERLTDLIYERIGSTDYLDQELFKITINDLLLVELNLIELHKEFLMKKE